jgi:hypothetical protein
MEVLEQAIRCAPRGPAGRWADGTMIKRMEGAGACCGAGSLEQIDRQTDDRMDDGTDVSGVAGSPEQIDRQTDDRMDGTGVSGVAGFLEQMVRGVYFPSVGIERLPWCVCVWGGGIGRRVLRVFCIGELSFDPNAFDGGAPR